MQYKNAYYALVGLPIIGPKHFIDIDNIFDITFLLVI